MFYIEGLLKTALFVSIFAVIANILLNYLLIPIFWGVGAAVASLITSTSSILVSLLILNFKTGIFWGERR
jgi:peptidoglycan biosynthesis protein MviN/MurJ (putative lipid II flippase)